MFDFVKNIMDEMRGLKSVVNKIFSKKKKSKFNAAKYMPESIRRKIIKEKPQKGMSRALISIIAAGLGALGIAVGFGAAYTVKKRLTKKAVILVGDGKNKPKLGNGGFNGYLLKYADIDGLEDMTDTLAANGFTELVIVPMTVVNGYVAEHIKAVAAKKREFFDKISCAGALLTESDDYERLANTLIACTEGADEDTAIVYVGKGTTHHSNAAYIALNERLRQLGSANIFIGTTSSYPDFSKVERDVSEARYQNVVLCPLEMTVDAELSGEIAGDKESWLKKFEDAGYNSGCYMKGLCAYRGVRELVVEHTKAVM